MSKLGVGVIGCGGIASTHCGTVAQRDDVDLVAVCDLDLARAQAYQSKFGAQAAYGSAAELLARDDIQCVIVAVPQGVHAEVAVPAAQAGKHLYCEKPMAVTLSQAEAMIEAAEAAGVTLQIGYCMRFAKDREGLRQAVRDGLLGRPVYFRVTYAVSSGPTTPWVHDADLGGGLFMEGAHDLDWARYVFGEPTSVYAVTHRFKPDATNAGDTATMIFQFEGGDTFVSSRCWAMEGFGLGRRRGLPQRMFYDLVGPHGTAHWPGPDDDPKIEVFLNGHHDEATELPWCGGWGVGREAYELELADFFDCVRTGRTPKCTGHDGKRALEMGLGAIESGRTGQAVKL